ncbi:MAG: chorismate mutase [Paracoccaceae bacterium]
MDLKPVADIANMEDLRVQIDQIDAALVRLLALRQAHIGRAAELKPGEGLPARIDDRVDAVLAHVRAKAEVAGLDAGLAETLWREMIEWAIAYEDRHMSQKKG